MITLLFSKMNRKKCRTAAPIILLLAALVYYYNVYGGKTTSLQNNIEENAALQVKTTPKSSINVMVQQKYKTVVVLLGSNDKVIKAGYFLTKNNPEMIMLTKDADHFKPVNWSNAQLVPSTVSLPYKDE